MQKNFITTWRAAITRFLHRFGRILGLDRGLSISCFGSYIGDSINAIMSTVAEIGVMSKLGGGTSGYFGDIRPRGSNITNNGKSNGSFAFTKLFEATIDTISQGTSP